MRAKEFITELNMAPGNLLRFAQSSAAANMQAGFEAELIVPGNYSNGAAGEFDLDADRTLTRHIDIDEIRHFFEIGRNDPATREIENDYENYVHDRLEIYIDSHLTEHKTRVKEENPDLDDDEIFNKAHEECTEEYYNSPPDLYDLFNDNRIRTYFDVYEQYSGSLTWPHYTSGSNFYDEVVHYSYKLEKLVGGTVEILDERHLKGKEEGFRSGVWYIEPDESIQPPEEDYMGIEIVSPPMPVIKMLEQLKNVLSWANNEGAYTDQSTGLHIGVSIKGLTADKIDYVKLALFLGDQYILQRFGREANTYTQSSINLIERAISGKLGANDIADKLVLIKSGFIQNVSKSILSTNANRNVSINANNEYVEFRSMGGDYLYHFDTIQNTVLRYIRAYAVAADPMAERQEYAKKLTRILNPNNDDILTPFVKFAMGEFPKKDLVISLKVRAMQKRADQLQANKKDDLQSLDAQPIPDFG